jgi:ketosteroid isomerase-like protein
MRRLVWAFVTGAALTAGAASAKPAAEESVLAAVTEYREAIAAGSLDRLGEAVHADLSVLEGTHLNRGWADYRDNHIGPEMKEWKEFRVSGPTIIETAVSGDLAYVVSRATYTLVFLDKSVVIEGADSFVLRKTGGRWRVRHVHSSGKRLREEKPRP